MSHTPGPWRHVLDFKCANGDITSGVVSTATGAAVAWPHGANAAEELANARLIAEAPAMLAMLPRTRETLASLIEETLCAREPARPFSSVMDEVRAHPLLKELDQIIRRVGVST